MGRALSPSGVEPVESSWGELAESPALPAKGFLSTPFQVFQAREAGASAILIIVRALTDEEIKGPVRRCDRSGDGCVV